MRKYIVLLFCVLTPTLLFSQNNSDVDEEYSVVFNRLDIHEFKNITQNTDSVKIALYSYTDKELSDVGEDESSFYNLISDAKLTKHEIKSLNKRIVSSSSYANTLSALGHVDIECVYYKADVVQYKILISSITRNIIMFDAYNEMIIRCGLNEKTFHFIGKLLRNKKIWNASLQFYFFGED